MLVSLIAVLLVIPSVATDDGSTHNVSTIRKIIIDPGHGGEDKGAVGPTGLLEKDVTLAIARKLRKLIISDKVLKASGVEVILTRDGDEDVSPEKRAALANSSRGDVFISIHTNSFSYRNVYGPETYFLSLTASDVHARKVAEVENQAFGNGGETEVEDDDLKAIIFDVMHNSHIEQSMLLAKEIQSVFNETLKLRDRGVKQAPFRVLKKVAMPAVLVEVDFISNPVREAELRKESYQLQIAGSLLASIKHYKRTKEGKPTVGSSNNS